MASKQGVEEMLGSLSIDVDDVPVGAADIRASVEPEINEVQSKIDSTTADTLLLQALTEIGQNSNANKGNTNDTHIAKDENALVDEAAAINLPRNMAFAADEAAALLEALTMDSEEMQCQSPSCHSLIKCIKTIVPKLSAAKLELLEIQEDINKTLRQVQEMEIVLMKKKVEYSEVLENNRKHLGKKQTSEEANRKKKELQNIVRKINVIKNFIQGLIHLNPKLLEKDEFFYILEETRKPVNLATYGLKQ